ncbi:hypothetical protein NDU88_004675 [Pleurodeles waltl]|uniref:Uncharacterized protein n=1 Tax=Pleurodeles waltl TaxID=8319 RepID=A0AAV7V1T0_PLEWA|nr:hypothetical protein NDU88_004675 [Pleurodeles waltl]
MVSTRASSGTLRPEQATAIAILMHPQGPKWFRIDKRLDSQHDSNKVVRLCVAIVLCTLSTVGRALNLECIMTEAHLDPEGNSPPTFVGHGAKTTFDYIFFSAPLRDWLGPYGISVSGFGNHFYIFVDVGSFFGFTSPSRIICKTTLKTTDQEGRLKWDKIVPEAFLKSLVGKKREFDILLVSSLSLSHFGVPIRT